MAKKRTSRKPDRHHWLNPIESAFSGASELNGAKKRFKKKNGLL